LALTIVIAPTEELPSGIPFTSHARAVPAGTHKEAVNTCVWPSVREIAAGEILPGLAQTIVTLAEADFEVSATLVAVTVTTAGEGRMAGAVYRPVVESLDAPLPAIVPSTAFPSAIPLTLQITFVVALPAPVTVAVKTCAPPVGTVAVNGEMLTTIDAGG
jgi:hypothetical protein